MEEQDFINAVVDNDLQTIQRDCINKNKLKQRDSFGFSPLELAQFLKKKEISSLLAPNLKQKVFFVEDQVLNIQDFEKKFTLSYTPFLFFPSYLIFQLVIHACPFPFKEKWGGKELELAYQKYEWELATGFVPPLSIQWIDSKIEWGLFAKEPLKQGDFVIEYTGLVIPTTLDKLDRSPYSMQYAPTHFPITRFTINSEKFGNESRFINHSFTPNLKGELAQDRGLVHHFFVANRDIAKGEQLTFDYGKDYWSKRGEPVKF
jgi:hypothetical protein